VNFGKTSGGGDKQRSIREKEGLGKYTEKG
jgi:hypothetical protein